MRLVPLMLVLLALLVRVGFFVALAHPEARHGEFHLLDETDEIDYHRLASTLVTTGKYQLFADGPPTAKRPPGMILPIAALYAVLGPSPWAALLWVMVCALLLIPLLGAMTTQVGGSPRAGWLAMAVTALLPTLVFTSGGIWSEPPSLFFTLLALYLLLRAEERSCLRHALGAALGLAMAFLIRPSVGLVIGLLGIWLLWRALTRRTSKDTLTPRPPLPGTGEGESESLTPKPSLPGTGEDETLTPQPPLPGTGETSLTPQPPLPGTGEGESEGLWGFRGRWRALGALLLFTVVTSVPILSWGARNWVVMGEPFLGNTESTAAVWGSNNAVTAGLQPPAIETFGGVDLHREAASGAYLGTWVPPYYVSSEVPTHLDEMALHRWFQDQTRLFIRTHPADYARLVLHKIRRTLTAEPMPPSVLGESPAKRRAKRLVTLGERWFLFLFGGFGLWLLWQRRPMQARYYLLFLLGSLPVVVIAYVNARIFLPVSTLLIVPAALALDRLRTLGLSFRSQRPENT